MSRHAVSEHILRMLVGIKREAGVTQTQIRNLIDEFAYAAVAEHDSDGTIGFLEIADIPTHSRAEFLSALTTLVAERESRSASPTSRSLSATDIWPSRIGG
jgi:hypothetical protein